MQDCLMNALLNTYFGGDTKGKAGFLIAPQKWTAELESKRKKPDFTVIYVHQYGAEEFFECVWVENKRPHESFYRAFCQVISALNLEGGNYDIRGMSGGFVIVAVGK